MKSEAEQSVKPTAAHVDISPEAVERAAMALEFLSAAVAEGERLRISCDDIEAIAAQLRELSRSLTAKEKSFAVANKLWKLCVDEGWPGPQAKCKTRWRKSGCCTRRT